MSPEKATNWSCQAVFFHWEQTWEPNMKVFLSYWVNYNMYKYSPSPSLVYLTRLRQCFYENGTHCYDCSNMSRASSALVLGLPEQALHTCVFMYLFAITKFIYSFHQMNVRCMKKGQSIIIRWFDGWVILAKIFQVSWQLPILALFGENHLFFVVW